MISLLLALTISAAPGVVEMNEPSAKEASIQAIVMLPELSLRERMVLRNVVHTMTRQTEEYGRREMSMVSLDGEQPQAEVMSDHVRIQILVPPGGVKGGVRLLDSLVRRASLFQEAIDTTFRAQLKQTPNYWHSALWTDELVPTPILRPEEVKVYQKVFRPDAITIAVGGEIVPDEAEDEWTRRTTDWKAPATQPDFGKYTASSPDRNEGGISTVELRGATFVSGDVAIPTRLLALIALGSGKDSALYRIGRERHAWSYRQESILWPVVGGWSPRLIWATTAGEDAPKRAETLRTELYEDVRSWNEAVRLRALGFAEGILSRGVELSPLYLTGRGPVSVDLADRTFFVGYWKAKTGIAWDAEKLLSRLRYVTLEDLKDAASEILSTSEPRIRLGR